MKIGVIGASLETPNLGVTTLAVGAVRCILSAYPGAEVFFLDYARESRIHCVPVAGRSVCVRLVPMRFTKRFWLPNNIAVLLGLAVLLRVIPWPGLHRWLIARNDSLRQICLADLVCSVAGGDSFSDLYGAARFVYCALPQVLALLLRKPLVLLPQTYGPFRNPALRRIAQGIVRNADRAWCRDAQSLADLMGGEGPEQRWGRTSFCYDMGFAVDPQFPATTLVEGFPIPTKRDPYLVGMNVSGLLYRGGYSGHNQFGLQCHYPRLVRTAIELLLSYPGTRILLIPHVYGCEPESDVAACEQVYGEAHSAHPARIAILRGTYCPGEIRHVIGMCGFFVGSRMHACIAAISQGVASLSIAYSEKFRGVLDMVGTEDLVADARSLSQLQLLAAIKDAFQKRACIAADLQAKLPDIRQRVLNLLVREQIDVETPQRTPIPA